MRKYEIGVILHPDLEIDLDSTTNKIEKIIEAAQGKIEKKDNWGKRKLAYKIDKLSWGIYIFYEVSLPSDKVSKIDANLRLSEEVIRHMIVSIDNLKRISKTTKTEESNLNEDKK